ncbi:MAG: hypothetical protein KDD44_10030, partial [Bdellovibrionales bacterium]|nr:hypothetical protein [Bdellovibrionales bacterium]
SQLQKRRCSHHTPLMSLSTLSIPDCKTRAGVSRFSNHFRFLKQIQRDILLRKSALGRKKLTVRLSRNAK